MSKGLRLAVFQPSRQETYGGSRIHTGQSTTTRTLGRKNRTKEPSTKELRTCASMSLICPPLSRRQGLRKLHPTPLPLRSNQLTGERFSLRQPILGAFCLALRPSGEIPPFP
jgi:hypothetical protein